ncbi:MAG: DUF6084 family protein [Candidatus Dormibacteraeota bacterium]|nr:DUF6084 family protein [Candidatus Dormibacteraeota bacterium]
MAELEFTVEGAEAVPFCASPTLALKLRVTNRAEDRVEAVALDCQVRLEAQRRRYSAVEKERLVELFGEPGRWSETLRSLLWTHAHASLPPFEGEARVDLHVPCSADFNVAAAKYFHGLQEGGVPVTLLFSGSVFHRDAEGALQVERIPWTAEATYDLPVATWKDLLQLYFPNTAWLTLRQDVFDRLYAFQVHRGLPTWEQALEELLSHIEEASPR